MRAALLAAGDGTRLSSLGVPKPLVRIGAESLLERTLRQLSAAGVDELVMIVNERNTAVVEAARALPFTLQIEAVIRTTPSSFDSLLAVGPALRRNNEPFLLATVDSVIHDDDFAGFASAFRADRELDVLLATTSFVDDERPLYVLSDETGRVRGLGAEAGSTSEITVGLYGLKPTIWPLADEAERLGISRLRNFLSYLVVGGYSVWAHRLGTAIDVDRPEDVVAAQNLIRTSCLS